MPKQRKNDYITVDQKVLSNYILKLVAMASFQGLTHKGESPFK